MSKTKSINLTGIPAEVHDALMKSMDLANANRKPMTPRVILKQHVVNELARLYKITIKSKNNGNKKASL